MNYRAGFSPAFCSNGVICDFRALAYEARAWTYRTAARRLKAILGAPWKVGLTERGKQGQLALRNPVIIAIKHDPKRRSVIPIAVNTRSNQVRVLMNGHSRNFGDLIKLADYMNKLVGEHSTLSLRGYEEREHLRSKDINRRRGNRRKK